MSSIEKISSGDLVSWKTLDKNNHFGIILKIYTKNLGNNRIFNVAQIATMNGRQITILLEFLNLESSLKNVNQL